VGFPARPRRFPVSQTEDSSVYGDDVVPSLQDMTVADAMNPGIVSCPHDAKIIDVARIMARHYVHCVAIMNLAHDESGELVVWGVVTDLDMLRGAIERDGHADVASLVEQPVITVRPALSLRDAGEVMLTNHVSHLVVTDPDTALPIGILSSLDIARALTWGGK
jgi:CBS domain-containing protein